MQTPLVHPRGARPRKARLSIWSGATARGYGLVTLGAMFWGSLGLFYHVVIGIYGLTSLETVFWRALIATLLLGSWLAVRQPQALRVRRQDTLLFLMLGAIGVAATFAIYAYAIRAVGMGVAAVLQYTAPAWVALFSVAFWGERMTRERAAALLLALVGVALVGRAYDLDAARLSLLGVAAALITGITYAGFVLQIKTATRRGYGASTILFYALAIGTLCLLPLQSTRSLAIISGSPDVIPWLIALGFVTLAAGITFSAGLKHVSASSGSIVATVEPMTAMLFGWAILGEALTLPQIAGAVCILAAVSALRLRTRGSDEGKVQSSSSSSST